MSISNWLKKINTQLLVVLAVVLMVFLGWGIVGAQATLGANTAISISSEGVSIALEQKSAAQSAAFPLSSQDALGVSQNRVVASKSGKKYHYLHCSGTKTIADKNKIYFDTAALAEKAGLTLAANCKRVAEPASNR